MYPRSHPDDRPAKSSKKVLVVDDVKDLLESLVALLRADGYRVVSAADGDAALRLAREEHADLIVMDPT